MRTFIHVSVHTFLSVYTLSCAQIIKHWKTKPFLGIPAYVRRIQSCVSVYFVICANNPALEDQNHYKEYLRTYADYTHVSLRY